MKKNNFPLFAVIFLMAGLYGCNIFDPADITDPNNPATEEVQQNANKSQLQNLVTGLEQRHRSSTVGIADYTGTFGREFYPMYASDPRFMTQWLGLGNNAEEDASFYQMGQAWSTPYLAVKQANLLIGAVNNTEAVTAEERNGYLGVAKTIKAFSYVVPLLTQSKENGIRLDVDDPLNPGDFVPFDAAIVQVRAMLDEAVSNLQSAGGSFAFTLSSGMASFSTPSSFISLNRALDARIALYEEDFEGALQSLNAAAPFFELAAGEAAMNKGAYFAYAGPPGAFNPYYYVPNASTSQILMVHPSMVEEAVEGDLRVENKFFERDEPVNLSGFSSRYQDNRFIAAGNTAPFPWIRNEELILIYAEAQAQTNNLAEAVEAINLVRNTWGLANFSAGSQSEIIDQILFERQYSLWGEFGHRWLDAIRYDRLDTIPDDGGMIFRHLARPLSETNWDDFASGN